MDSFLNKLEKIFGKFAIHQLALGLIIPKIAVWGLAQTDPMLIPNLALDPFMVKSGQVWRILTFLAIPPTLNAFWLFFALYIFYMFYSALEEKWGAFKLNVYFFTSWFLTVAVSLILNYPILFSFDIEQTIFLAFAVLFPNYPLSLFFFLPVPVKYLAIFAWAKMGLDFFKSNWMGKVMILALVGNYLIFFGKHHYLYVKNSYVNYQRRKKFKENFKR